MNFSRFSFFISEITLIPMSLGEEITRNLHDARGRLIVHSEKIKPVERGCRERLAKCIYQ